MAGREPSAPKRRIFGAIALLAVVVAVWIFSAPIAQWSRSTQPADIAAFLGEHLLAVGLLGGCLLVLALILLPKWQAARSELTGQERFEVENEARKTLAEIIGGAAVLAGLFFTWENLRITQETATKSQELTREGQVTERFTKAIDQLGVVNDKGEKQLEIRLGGIYALERIARDSERDHWPIMEILTAYVRAHAPWPPKDAPPRQDDQSAAKTPSAKNEPASPQPAADIQAILTVLGRRTRLSREGENQRLDLAYTDLRGAGLEGAHLERAILWGTQLEEARLSGAHLERADLWGANLDGAILWSAHLEGARLWEAGLEGAHLWDAHLEEVDLKDAHLKGARDLTVEQLCTVRTLDPGRLDPPLMEQMRQQCPKVLEKPQE